jgi:hypothetical protein
MCRVRDQTQNSPLIHTSSGEFLAVELLEKKGKKKTVM